MARGKDQSRLQGGICRLRHQHVSAHRPAAEVIQHSGDSAEMFGTGTATNTCTIAVPVGLSQNDTVSSSPRWSQPIQRHREHLLAFFQVRLVAILRTFRPDCG